MEEKKKKSQLTVSKKTISSLTNPQVSVVDAGRNDSINDWTCRDPCTRTDDGPQCVTYPDYPTCAYTCAYTCAITCVGGSCTCPTNEGYSCDPTCAPSCGATCAATCPVTCGGSCYETCLPSCGATCGATCSPSCNPSCAPSCDTCNPTCEGVATCPGFYTCVTCQYTCYPC